MRFKADRPIRRRSVVVTPFVTGAIAFGASACSSSPSTATSSTAASGSPSVMLSAGLAAQNAHNDSVAIDDYKNVVAAAPSSSTASYANYDLGVIAQIDQNDPAAAATYYRAALAVNPNLANALYNLAIVVTSTHPLVAENTYKQVIAIQPNNADAHLNLGFIYLAQAKKALAHAQFAKAVSLDASLAKRIPTGS